MWVYRGYDIKRAFEKFQVTKDGGEPLYFGDCLMDAQTWIDSEKRKQFNAKS